MPFTKEQELAINDRGHDILVSASAGSGKTTVLVQRVLKEILSGTGVDQLLIVTFTKAAATEMKERIKQELIKALRSNTGNRQYLRTQLSNVDTANISTIDAFCLDIIHRFYYAVNLDPSFSILTDETQAALLKEKALKDVENHFFEINDPDFLAFYDNFAGDRDAESPRNLLLDLYNFAMAKPDYQTWLKNLANPYELTDTIVTMPIWQDQIKPYLLSIFTNLKQKLDQVLDNPLIEDTNLAKVNDSFKYFEKNLLTFIDLLKNDASYNELREALRACIFPSFRKSKKWDEVELEFYERIQDLKTEAKDQVFETFMALFINDETEQSELLNQGHKIVTAISKAELELIQRFNQLKREQNLLDYSDMEQLAYQILSQDTSNAKLAQQFYQKKFKEILVDEYQDINELQERIIQLLKNDEFNHLFMVGDVKQSIYGFRQAEPSLFLKKYHLFGENTNEQQKRIVLADNFRSSQPVVNLVNQVFNPIMTDDFGGIDYEAEGQLKYGATYYPTELEQAAEIIYHKKTRKNKAVEVADDNLDFSEIQMVIQRIKQLEQEKVQVYDAHLGKLRPFKYSDIAILTRSRSSNLEIMQEFAKNNIPLFVSDAANYFQTFELTIIMNYLKIIDNPDQDIPLATVLRSPIFSFNEKDFAKIRIHSKNTSFYHALSAYVSVKDELAERIRLFLNQLEDFRNFSTVHRISELIWSIYEKTSLLEIMTSMPNGKQRRVNLETLYERASSYESAGFKGLYQFINFIERIRKSQKDLAQPLLSKEADNAIKLMTIHGSKGLEFPIVFYLGLDHRYQKKDITSDFVITSEYLGITLRQEHYRADTLVKAIGNIKKKRQILEEESRILYVALTRAKQKLILVTDIENYDDQVEKWQKKLIKGKLPETDKLGASSPLSFIGPTLNLEQHLSQKISDVIPELERNATMLYLDFSPDDYEILTANDNKESKQEQELGLLQEASKKLFDFSYPFSDASQTTAYQAVSEIKKAFNDPIQKELENAHLIKSNNRFLQPINTRPAFLFENKYTGAEIGTATHLILQYYDYTERSENQLGDEVKQLVANKKLDPAIVQYLKLDQIDWFVHSSFAKMFWEHPDQLEREVDFSSLLPAANLFANFSDPQAKILVHGTIDGYFVDQDGIILFDYKTDFVDKSHLDSAIEEIQNKYHGQLRLYEQAINSFSQKQVKAKYLILLDAKQIVAIN